MAVLIAVGALAALLAAMVARPSGFVRVVDAAVTTVVTPLAQLHRSLVRAIEWTRTTAVTTARQAVPSENVARGVAWVAGGLVAFVASVLIEKAFLSASFKLLGLGRYVGFAAAIGILAAAVFAEMIHAGWDTDGPRFNARVVLGGAGLLIVFVFATMLAMMRAGALGASSGAGGPVVPLVLLAWLSTGLAAVTGWTLPALVELAWALVLIVTAGLLIVPMAATYLLIVVSSGTRDVLRAATGLASGEPQPAPDRGTKQDREPARETGTGDEGPARRPPGGTAGRPPLGTAAGHRASASQPRTPARLRERPDAQTVMPPSETLDADADAEADDLTPAAVQPGEADHDTARFVGI